MRAWVLFRIAAVVLVVGVTVAVALPRHRCPPHTTMEVIDVPYRQIVCFGSEGAGPVEDRTPLKVGVGLGSVLAAVIVAAAGLVAHRRRG